MSLEPCVTPTGIGNVDMWPFKIKKAASKKKDKTLSEIVTHSAELSQTINTLLNEIHEEAKVK